MYYYIPTVAYKYVYTHGYRVELYVITIGYWMDSETEEKNKHINTILMQENNKSILSVSGSKKRKTR